MDKTLLSNAGDEGSIPGWGIKTHMTCGQKNQNIKQKQYCTTFNKDFRNCPHLKKNLRKCKTSEVDDVERLFSCNVANFLWHGDIENVMETQRGTSKSVWGPGWIPRGTEVSAKPWMILSQPGKGGRGRHSSNRG